MTFEEWRKEHLTMDGYPQYTAEDAWQASRLAALEQIAGILASEIECAVFERHVVPALDVARKVLTIGGEA